MTNEATMRADPICREAVMDLQRPSSPGESSTMRARTVVRPARKKKALAGPEDRHVRISLVIPTMNEEENIPHVFPKIPPIVTEIIVVDSSRDNTVEVIRRYAPDARIIRTRPMGKGNALKIGFEHATGDVIVMLDADGSMDPGEIQSFVTPLAAGYDVVQGSRILGGSEDLTITRRFGNFVFVALVNNLFRANYTDLCYGYRAFTKAAISRVEFESNGFDVETELTIRMQKAGLRICEVPSYETQRINGASNLSTFADGFRILTRIFRELKA